MVVGHNHAYGRIPICQVDHMKLNIDDKELRDQMIEKVAITLKRVI